MKFNISQRVKFKERATLRKAIRFDRSHASYTHDLTVANINRQLTEQQVHLHDRRLWKFALGISGKIPEELCIRQFLLRRFAGTKLNFALQSALADPTNTLVYPLPREWQQFFQGLGIKVARWQCTTLFAFQIFVIWGYGVVEILKCSFFQFRSFKYLNQIDNSGRKDPYVYFDRLLTENINPPTNRVTFDILSWFVQWDGRDGQTNIIRHSCQARQQPFHLDQTEIQYQKYPVPPLGKGTDILRYLIWGLIATVFSFYQMFFGRWWYGLLLHQASNSALLRLSAHEVIGRHYYFHNSGMFTRELWTYEAEKKGSQITLYFYSINSETHKTPIGYLPPMFGFRVMNWPNYLVWNKFHADFIKRAKSSSFGKITTVGQIWFSDTQSEISFKDPNLVAVFDTTPVRPIEHAKLGLDNQYLTYPTIKLFLEDVLTVSEKLGLKLAFKPKRKPKQKFKKHYDRRYLNIIENLGDSDKFVHVDADVAAQKLIAASSIVISLPFSTPALIAQQMGKPSVYYDPSGRIFKDDRAAYGIPIISGKENLEEWLRKQIR